MKFQNLIWRDNPHIRMTIYPEGTMFLLKTGIGRIWFCVLRENTTAKRMHDQKVIDLQNHKSGEVSVLAFGLGL